MAASSSTPLPDAVFEWPGPHGVLHGRLFRGSLQRRCDALLVFFHPGGFVQQEETSSDACIHVLAQACQLNVLAPSYALAPEQPFPAAIEDAHRVLAQVVEARAALSWSGKYLLVGGVEAGGNLAAVAALMCRDRCGPKLAGQILVMPMLDASLQSPSMRAACAAEPQDDVAKAVEYSYRCYLSRLTDRTHPYVSPLQSSRLEGLAPALVLYADNDPLCDEARNYATKLAAAGVWVESLALHPDHVRNAQERCQATADDPGIQAIARFVGAVQVAAKGAAAAS